MQAGAHDDRVSSNEARAVSNTRVPRTHPKPTAPRPLTPTPARVDAPRETRTSRTPGAARAPIE